MFAHLLDSHYSSPTITGSTIAEQAASFVATLFAKADFYNTSNLLLPWGNDFAFVDAEKEFANIDALLTAVRGMGLHNLTIEYATLDDYFQALHADPTAIFTESDGIDFFPYLACPSAKQHSPDCLDLPTGAPDAFWTGFYTHQPLQKLLSYQQDAMLRFLKL